VYLSRKGVVVLVRRFDLTLKGNQSGCGKSSLPFKVPFCNRHPDKTSTEVNNNKDSQIVQENLKISGQILHSLITVFISFCATIEDTLLGL